jgi:hypothetical protein
MYCAKNTADGNSMSSCNKGTATCFDDADCPPSSPRCTGFGLPKSVPQGAGICVMAHDIPDGKGCTKARAACGLDLQGYPDAGWECTDVNGSLACLPPASGGLGKLLSGSPPLYSSCAGMFNPDWITAAKTAGTTASPFYETFKAACPAAYAWQYDDISSDYTCPDPSADLGFAVEFCPSMAAPSECSPQQITSGVPGCRPTKVRGQKRGVRSSRTSRSR